ncbi:MAG: hypothetical protein FK734_13190 [Asgard group archaeon]|nr:hypothetical protein [Asgard group archaeon]
MSLTVYEALDKLASSGDLTTINQAVSIIENNFSEFIGISGKFGILGNEMRLSTPIVVNILKKYGVQASEIFYGLSINHRIPEIRFIFRILAASFQDERILEEILNWDIKNLRPWNIASLYFYDNQHRIVDYLINLYINHEKTYCGFGKLWPQVALVFINMKLDDYAITKLKETFQLLKQEKGSSERLCDIASILCRQGDKDGLEWFLQGHHTSWGVIGLSHFYSDPRVVAFLERPTLMERYGYKIPIAIVMAKANNPKCLPVFVDEFNEQEYHTYLYPFGDKAIELLKIKLKEEDYKPNKKILSELIKSIKKAQKK